MPRAYRPMKSEGDPPRPVVGDSATKLGIRERDLKPDDEGNAVPGNDGLSVVSSLSGLRQRVAQGRFSPTMVPHRLNDNGIVPGAIGNNSLHVFRLGDGSFERGVIADRLMLVPDRHEHGTIQPATAMPYNAFREALVNTRDLWVSGEGDHDR